MCGTIQGGKPGKGKEKALGKSPPMKARMNKSCRDMSTQTNVSPVLHKKEVINMIIGNKLGTEVQVWKYFKRKI